MNLKRILIFGVFAVSLSSYTQAQNCDPDTTIANEIKLKAFWLKQQQKNLDLSVSGIDTNQWHYIAITKSSNRIGKVYIDGILRDSGLFDSVNYRLL